MSFIKCFNARLSYLPRRLFSTRLQVSLEDNTGLATVALSDPPVNNLSGDFLKDISDTFNQLDNDDSVKGILLTSKFHGKVFSSGFNLLDMFNRSENQLAEFFHFVQEWYLSMYGLSKPLAAAVNGHAFAGGCAMAMMADYRTMLPGKTIGLNETLLGLIAPYFMADLMTSTIGERASIMALQLGTLFESNDALKIGLIDEVIEADSIIAKTRAELLKFTAISLPAFRETKLQFRRQKLDKLRNNREEVVANIVKILSLPTTQTALGGYLEKLKGKKKEASQARG